MRIRDYAFHRSHATKQQGWAQKSCNAKHFKPNRVRHHVTVKNGWARSQRHSWNNQPRHELAYDISVRCTRYRLRTRDVRPSVWLQKNLQHPYHAKISVRQYARDKSLLEQQPKEGDRSLKNRLRQSQSSPPCNTKICVRFAQEFTPSNQLSARCCLAERQQF